MGDVLGTNRLLGEASLKRRAQRRIAVRLEERVQALDFANPRTRPARRELGQIGECRGAKIDQVLALQVARARLPETAAARWARCSGRIERMSSPHPVAMPL